MADKKISRRSFLQSTALIGGAAMIPSLLMGGNAGAGNKRVAPPKVVGANEKVGVALIGIGNRGAEVAKEFHKTGLCDVVALATWTWARSTRRRSRPCSPVCRSTAISANCSMKWLAGSTP